MVISMLVTDVGAEIYGDDFSHFNHQHPLPFYMSVDLKYVNNIPKSSPILSHQHQFSPLLNGFRQ